MLVANSPQPGSVWEPQVEDIFIKHEPMDLVQEMNEPEEDNNEETQFISTVKIEPLEIECNFIATKDDTIKCNECNFVTDKNDELILHVATVHSKIRVIKCKECEFIINRDINKDMRHIATVQGQKKFECVECEYTTTRKDTLRSVRRHIIKHSQNMVCDHQLEDLKQKPKDGDQEMIKQEPLDGDQEMIKQEPIDGDQEMIKQEPIDDDQEINEPDKNYVEIPFVSIVKEEAPEDGNGDAICQVCGDMPGNLKKLKTHLLLKHSKLHLCMFCIEMFGSSKEFDNSSKYNEHYSSHHKGIMEQKKVKKIIIKPFKCDECSKSCSTKQNLKTHKLIHTGIKPYLCDECSTSCSTKQNLKTHKLIHLRTKPVNCGNISK